MKWWEYLLYILLVIGLMVLAESVEAQQFEREGYYSDLICESWGGEATRLPSGIRPDCEVDFAVMEFDWAYRTKHYECIGQALYYAFETGKIPVCVLLARSDEEAAYGVRASMNDIGVETIVIDVRENVEGPIQ